MKTVKSQEGFLFSNFFMGSGVAAFISFLAYLMPAPKTFETAIPWLLVAIFASVAGGFIATAFPAVRKRLTRRVKNGLSGAFMMLFGAPFLCIGAWHCAEQIKERVRIDDYVPVPAKVISSKLESHRHHGRRSHGVTYSVAVRYEYEYGGRKYESDRYSASQISSNNYARHKAEAARFRPGEVTTAYVLPYEPETSVLVRAEGKDFASALAFGIVFGFAGIGIVLGGAYMLAKSLAGAKTKHCAGQVLKRSCGELFAAGLFALVWNVFSWCFAIGFLGEVNFRHPDLTLFAVLVFPVAGIGLAVAFFRQLARAAKFPKLEIKLWCDAWKPGGVARASCTLADASALEEIEISLESVRHVKSGRRMVEVADYCSRCCSYRAPVPQSWVFEFQIPEKADAGCSWRFNATMRRKSGKGTYATMNYALPW